MVYRKKNEDVLNSASTENARSIQETDENMEHATGNDRSEASINGTTLVWTRDPYRVQEDDRNLNPGVYFVDGDCHYDSAPPLQNSQDTSHEHFHDTSHENSQIELGPIFANSCIVLCVEGKTTECFNHRQKNIIFVFVTLTIFFATAISTFCLFFVQKQGSNKSMYTSPLQTSSPAPSPIDLAYVKQILIPISGEDVLDDPKTIQHYTWQKISSNLWFHRDQGDFDTRDERKIIQRYSIFVVVISMAFDLSSLEESKVFDQTFPDECTFFSCNDLGEVTVFVVQNERTTKRGGGTIAKEIGALNGLTHLVLKKNALHGEIPSEIGQLESLQLLDLQENTLGGTIPTEIGQLKNLSWMFLNKNNLTGSIPMEMSNIVKMCYADLSDNKLTGSIPLTLSKLGGLKGLALEHNNFSGDVSFLCKGNYTNEPYLRNEYLGISLYLEHSYLYAMNFSLTIDCEYEDTYVLSCYCCTCAE